MISIKKLLTVSFAVIGLGVLAHTAKAQDQSKSNPLVAPPPHAKQIHLKHVLVIGETKGFEHDSVSDAHGSDP